MKFYAFPGLELRKNSFVKKLDNNVLCYAWNDSAIVIWP